MATVKENLIAARALIDTPEKYETAWRKHGTALGHAVRILGHARGQECETAIVNALGSHWRRGCSLNFDDTMALFDRAIAAQEEAP